MKPIGLSKRKIKSWLIWELTAIAIGVLIYVFS